jgi:2-polyprenyl-6-methoxyphenol hydroxylase-like FAD-dependent oxidoreductase
MATEVDVIIVGAGVGGAALALAFAHAHPLRVLLIEQRSGPGNINRGDSMLPAITRHVVAWQALDRFIAAGARAVDRMSVYHHRHGLLMDLPLTGTAEAPYLVLRHPEIERTFTVAACATGRVEVRYRTKVQRLIEDGGRVRGITCVGEDGTEEQIHARLVVGADGATSRVRQQLGIELPLVPYDHSYFSIELERPAGYQDAMRLDLHPEGGVLVMPQEDCVSLGVLVLPAQKDLFHSGAFADKVAAVWRRSPLLADRPAIPKSAHLYSLSRGHAARYHARGCVLIGDALHVTNPTAGQGMTMAIEDGAALAAEVAPVLAAHGDDVAIDQALARYQAIRHPANARLVRLSHWMGWFYSFGRGFGDGVRRRVFAFGMSPLGRAIQRKVWSRVATRSGS